MVLSDGPVGVRGTSWDERDWGANSPSPTALAASWDPDLVEEVGALLGAEARRKNVDVLLAPTVNLHRTPYGGRHFECLSEDPHLTARIGTAYVSGVQRQGVGATLKHYVANDSETERMTYEAIVDERTLHEIYLRPFEDIIAAACPWLVMAAYNAVNGPTMTENALLTDPLRERWTFDGVVVSDWNAVRTTAHSARADIDLAMPGPGTPWAGGEARRGSPRGRSDRGCHRRELRRLLQLAERVGALKTVPVGPRVGDAPDAGPLLRRAAAAGAVLVRNDGVLPLPTDRLRRVAVLGPGAEHIRVQGGGSAWVSPPYVVSPVDGLVTALGHHVEVVTSVGAVIDDRLRPFTAAQASDPVDGSAGLRVRLRDADGTCSAMSIAIRRGCSGCSTPTSPTSQRSKPPAYSPHPTTATTGLASPVPATQWRTSTMRRFSPDRSSRRPTITSPRCSHHARSFDRSHCGPVSRCGSRYDSRRAGCPVTSRC